MSRSARRWSRRRCRAHPMSVGYHQWLHTARRSPRRRRLPPGGRMADRVPDRHPPRRQAADLAGRDARRRCAGGGTGTRVWTPRCAGCRWPATTSRVGPRRRRRCTATSGSATCSSPATRSPASSTGRTAESPAARCATWRASRSATASTSTGTPGPGTGCSATAGLRRAGFAPGMRYGLPRQPAGCPAWSAASCGTACCGSACRPALWYDVALIGIGEVAASANDDEFGAGHLELLARPPREPAGGRVDDPIVTPHRTGRRPRGP